MFLQACVDPPNLTVNRVNVHVASQPDGLHPTNDNSAVRSHIFKYVHGTLLTADIRLLETIPHYSLHMPIISDNGLEYTFTLREDAVWDDGSAFTSEDVAYSTKMMLNPLSDNAAIRSFYGSVIKAIKTYPGDPQKVTMVAHDVHINNREIMGGIYLIQKSKWDPNGVMDGISFSDLFNKDFKESSTAKDPSFIKYMNEYNNADNGYQPDRIVGLGPYRVEDWKANQSITLIRKDNWWGDSDTSMFLANEPDKIVFKIIKDESASYLEVKNQNIDVSAGMGTSKLIKLRKLGYFNENYYSDFLDQYSYSYIGLNCRPDGIKRKPFFVDKKVRRAMAHLTPVQEIIDVIVYGMAQRIIANVNPLKYDHADHLKPIEFDVEKAKALLAEAGWVDTDGDNIVDKDGIKFSFQFNYGAGSGTSKEIMLMIKEAMYEGGIELLPNPCDFTSLYKYAQDHDFDAMQAGWSGGSGPDDPIQLWGTEAWATKGSNFTGFGNAYTDALIVKANKTLDLEERKKIMIELQEAVYDWQPYIFLYSVKRKVLVHRRFDNGRGYSERPGVYAGNLALNPNWASAPKTPTSATN